MNFAVIAIMILGASVVNSAAISLVFKAAGGFACAGALTGGCTAYNLREKNIPAREMKKDIAFGAAVGAGVGLATLGYWPIWLARGVYDTVTRPERFSTYDPKPTLVDAWSDDLVRQMAIAKEKREKSVD